MHSSWQVEKEPETISSRAIHSESLYSVSNPFASHFLTKTQSPRDKSHLAAPFSIHSLTVRTRIISSALLGVFKSTFREQGTPEKVNENCFSLCTPSYLGSDCDEMSKCMMECQDIDVF